MLLHIVRGVTWVIAAFAIAMTLIAATAAHAADKEKPESASPAWFHGADLDADPGSRDRAILQALFGPRAQMPGWLTQAPRERVEIREVIVTHPPKYVTNYGVLTETQLVELMDAIARREIARIRTLVDLGKEQQIPEVIRLRVENERLDITGPPKYDGADSDPPRVYFTDQGDLTHEEFRAWERAHWEWRVRSLYTAVLAARAVASLAGRITPGATIFCLPVRNKTGRSP